MYGITRSYYDAVDTPVINRLAMSEKVAIPFFPKRPICVPAGRVHSSVYIHTGVYARTEQCLDSETRIAPSCLTATVYTSVNDGHSSEWDQSD